MDARARISRWIERVFSRFHARWRTRLLSKSLTATPYFHSNLSLSLSLVFLRSPLPLSSLVVVVVETSNNVPNDRLFSSGDVHLPANRKPVKMNPLNREQVHTDQLCNSFEERDTNKSSRRSKQEAFCAGRNARHEVEIFESSFPI